MQDLALQFLRIVTKKRDGLSTDVEMSTLPNPTDAQFFIRACARVLALASNSFRDGDVVEDIAIGFELTD